MFPGHIPRDRSSVGAADRVHVPRDAHRPLVPAQHGEDASVSIREQLAPKWLS